MSLFIIAFEFRSISASFFVVLQVMVIINGPEPLDVDELCLGVLLELVPHGEPALSVNITLDVDVILSL